MPQFSIIIPVCNKWELTRNCLASLREHGSGYSFEVIVVDNGSTDATATELRSYGKSLFADHFRSIILPENKNFGPACNIGAKAAKSPVLFFLNNDTLVTPGWAEPLVQAVLEDAATGAVGPLLLYPDDTVQHLGVAFGTVGPFHLYQEFPKDHPVVGKTREPQALTGAAFMIKADLFHACGCFYEEYKNGFEDLDLCVQIKKRGKKLRYIPQSVIYHLESQTPNRKAGDGDNSLIFTRRCAAKISIDAHTHALCDGFRPFITDLLTIGVRLRQEEEEALTGVANGKDGSVWLHLIKQNPFWIRGLEIVANSLEQAGKTSEALPFYIKLVNLEPFLPRYRKLLRLASSGTSDTSWVKSVTADMEKILAVMGDKTVAENKIQATFKKFPRSSEDAFLRQAYTEKLNHFFPE